MATLHHLTTPFEAWRRAEEAAAAAERRWVDAMSRTSDDPDPGREQRAGLAEARERAHALFVEAQASVQARCSTLGSVESLRRLEQLTCDASPRADGGPHEMRRFSGS